MIPIWYSIRIVKGNILLRRSDFSLIATLVVAEWSCIRQGQPLLTLLLSLFNSDATKHNFLFFLASRKHFSIVFRSNIL